MVLFSIFHILSGILLTVAYFPNIEAAWNVAGSLPNQVMMQGSSFSLTWLFGLLSGTIAYFIVGKVNRQG